MSNLESNTSEQGVSTRILVGLIIGTLIGIVFNIWGTNSIRDGLLTYVFQPMGLAFLRGLFLVVVPLVLSSLIVGVANLGSAEHVRKLGGRLILFYISTTIAAILIGQILITVVEPGVGIDPAFKESARASLAEQVEGLKSKSESVKSSLWPGLVETVIPKNAIQAMADGNMLAIIFISILFGVALLTIEPKKSQSIQLFFSGISDVCITIVGWIMKVAPYAVAALMINAVAHFGAEIMLNVLKYILVVFTAYLLQFFGTYSFVVKYFIKIPIKEFYKRIMPIVATAFSTSSSSATMPTTIRTLEKRFGVPESITTFSIPLGATVNMDGTALFEVIAALFVAQVFDVHIGLTGQITLVILVLLTSIGVAGVPGGSIPILMSAMASLGIPPEGIALVLGVDRLLDMGRTVVNVTGDTAGALYLARVEKVPLDEKLQELD